MIKKKARKKAAANGAKKRTSKKRELNPAAVRKEVSLMVESEATEMAQAVIDRGKMGEVPSVKYLFEMASIFPASKNVDEATAEEESLAKTLLHRLNIPEEPVVAELDEGSSAEKGSGENVVGESVEGSGVPGE